MDYFEGLFLGKLWSDTDYENRNHVGLFFLYGLFVDAIVLYNYVYETKLLGIGDFTDMHLILFVILFIACPFICFKYYRMPIWGKLIVLCEKIFKAYIVLSFTVSIIIPRITVQKDGLQDFVVNYLNSTLETYTEKFSANAGSFSTVMGVLAGGLHTVVVIVMVIAVLVLVPGLIYIATRIVQFCYDWLIDRLLLRKVFGGYRK